MVPREQRADRSSGGRQDRHHRRPLDAWFDGFIPQLVTAVWVGDPAARRSTRLVQGYTPGPEHAGWVRGVPNRPGHINLRRRPADRDLGRDDESCLSRACRSCSSLRLTGAISSASTWSRTSPGMDLTSATNALAGGRIHPIPGRDPDSGYTPGTVATPSPRAAFRRRRGAMSASSPQAGPLRRHRRGAEPARSARSAWSLPGPA